MRSTLELGSTTSTSGEVPGDVAEVHCSVAEVVGAVTFTSSETTCGATGVDTSFQRHVALILSTSMFTVHFLRAHFQTGTPCHQRMQNKIKC